MEKDEFGLAPIKEKRKVFLLYPYYWPLYKAGGPVQSLYNLVEFFKEEVDFYCVSLTIDIDGSRPVQLLNSNVWCKGQHNENIYYTSRSSTVLLLKLIRTIRPDVLLITGLFNYNFVLPGIIAGKLFGIKIIISPRGMLQSWGLKKNLLVKKIFLLGLRFLVNKNESWHATDLQEKSDIQKHFGVNQVTHIASNIPRKLGLPVMFKFPSSLEKIKLVFLSLINSNKNLHLAIDEVMKANGRYSLDIYGPIVNIEYWLLCCKKMEGCSWINYKGAVNPWQVPEILQLYHFFILPTQGENFGHAIFDALSSGVPVIISDKTPWQKIDSNNAGFYIDLSNPDSLQEILITISRLSVEQYDKYREQSWKYAANFIMSKNFKKEYKFLIK